MNARGLIALLVAAVGCSADQGELRRVTFDVELQGLAADPPVVQTALGWEVTLTAAELSVAGVYFRNAEPGSGTTDEQGRVVAQVLGPFTLDALASAPTRVEVDASALTERVRSAELWLTEAQEGPIVDAVGPMLAHVAGVARRDDQEIPFDGGLALPQRDDARAYEAWQNRHIRRLAADFVAAESGVLRISVDPSRFFDSLPFDALGPADDTREISSDAEQLQLRNGLASPSGYGFSFEP